MEADYREISPSESLFLRGAPLEVISLYQNCVLLHRELTKELIRRDMERYGEVRKETEEFLTQSNDIESVTHSNPASDRPKPKGFAPPKCTKNKNPDRKKTRPRYRTQ